MFPNTTLLFSLTCDRGIVLRIKHAVHLFVDPKDSCCKIHRKT